nr:MAG TPA: hypothetical protein [Caudoviricetes sp.]DAX48229.1 MAG TPA: hypothetical protein [Caudoviricetes sp.]
MFSIAKILKIYLMGYAFFVAPLHRVKIESCSQLAG